MSLKERLMSEKEKIEAFQQSIEDIETWLSPFLTGKYNSEKVKWKLAETLTDCWLQLHDLKVDMFGDE